MKVFLTLAVTILFFLPAIAQHKNDRQSAGLLGAVKTVDRYTVSYWGGKPIKQPSSVSTFNRKGDLISTSSYDEGGRVFARLTYTFDGKGRKDGFESYYFDSRMAQPILNKILYVFDEKGRKVEEKRLNLDGTFQTVYFCVYDARGNKIEEAHHGNKTSRSNITVYTYDERGNPTSQTYFQAPSPTYKITMAYDARGNRVQWFDGRNKILSRYDNRGRILEEETIPTNPQQKWIEDPDPGKFVYSYDDKKRTKEVIRYAPDGIQLSRTTFSFDDRGNETGWVSFRGDKTTRSKTEIVYDSKGNWTKKTYLHSPNGAAFFTGSIEVRVITYY